MSFAALPNEGECHKFQVFIACEGNIARHSQIEAAWKGTAECRSCGIRDLVLFADLTEPDSKLVQYLPDGTQRIVRLLRRGAIAGLEVLVGSTYEHSAVVLQEAAVCRIPREVIDRLNRETPRLHRQLMQRWHQSLRQADEWLTELSTGSARERLARLFLQLAGDAPERPVRVFGREDSGGDVVDHHGNRQPDRGRVPGTEPRRRTGVQHRGVARIRISADSQSSGSTAASTASGSSIWAGASMLRPAEFPLQHALHRSQGPHGSSVRLPCR
ncbi:Crp/Fnr family transcriptional regulator [Azospirillum sp. BE72]|uniref:Crp/Fnr family transcriptional regulator n=1 Tax=Azospirillum sp. BE72 TaxID=2817776 RepID=UPI0028658B0B|nr:Crp/Fnr family transcriptional regulator [Azospirillum sp. BE72]MDR6773608.1 CRP-like cAMP-binding protein [Azospirillum sp. BE72]